MHTRLILCLACLVTLSACQKEPILPEIPEALDTHTATIQVVDGVPLSGETSLKRQ